jgi:hypothetical protein
MANLLVLSGVVATGRSDPPIEAARETLRPMPRSPYKIQAPTDNGRRRVYSFRPVGDDLPRSARPLCRGVVWGMFALCLHLAGRL